MLQSKRLLAWLMLCLAVALAMPAPSASAGTADPIAGSDVSITATPDALEVPEGSSRAFALTVKNEGVVEVTAVRLELTTDPGLTATPANRLPVTLPAGASAAMTISVSRGTDTPAGGSVIALVAYESTTDGIIRSHAQATSLTVSGPAAPPLGVSAEWRPETVELERGEKRSAALLVSNPTDSTLTNVTVRPQNVQGFDVEVLSGEPIVYGSFALGSIASGGSVSVVFSIKRTEKAVSAASSLGATVSFTSRPEQRSQALATQLTLGLRDQPAARAAALTVTNSDTELALIQYRSADLVFIIHNESNHAQLVNTVEVTAPNFLELVVVGGMDNDEDPEPHVVRLESTAELGPGDTRAVRVRVSSERPVQPGKSLISVSVAGTDVSDESTSTIVDSVAIDMSVLGESDVLSLLGVPSLLFVPGLIFAVVLWALLKHVWPRLGGAITTTGDGMTKVTFWVFALFPTLVFPFIYPPITSWVLDERRDYKKAYGLDDILYVWTMAAALAFLLWLIGMLFVRAWRTVRVPLPGDSPLTVIRKIGSRVPLGDNALTRPSLTMNGQAIVALADPFATTVIVSPTIVIGQSEALTADEKRQLSEHIEQQHPLRLAVLLWRKKKNLAIGWNPAAPIATPRAVTQTEITRQPGTINLVDSA